MTRKVLVYKDTSGGFRYRATGGNNRLIGASEESFTHLDYVVEKAHSLYPDAEVRVKYDESNYVVGFDEDDPAA